MGLPYSSMCVDVDQEDYIGAKINGIVILRRARSVLKVWVNDTEQPKGEKV